MIRQSPAQFKRKLKTACQHPLICDRAAWATTRHLQEMGVDWTCNDCGKILRSRQALAVHRAIAHKARHQAHWLVRDTYCPVCLTQFWTRHKVLEHLQEKAPRCFAYLQLTAERISDEEAFRLDAEAAAHARATRTQGSRRASAIRPAVRLAGPLPNVPMEDLPGGRHHPLGVGRRWLN